MQKVGDPIDGYCVKCKRNVFMNVAATDGREIFATVCRTCSTKQDYRPEVSQEVLQEAALKKLQRMQARKRKVSLGRVPDVISRVRRNDVIELPLGAFGGSRAELPSAPTPAVTREPAGATDERAAADRPREGAPASDVAPPAAMPRRTSAVGADGAPPAPSESREAVRHRPSLNDGPVPAGRRRSGVSVLPIPLSQAKPKEETLPPPNVDSDITAQWRARTAHLGPRDGKVYLSDRTYQVGDVLLHKRHGMGIVESVVHSNAIMVLFRDTRQVIEMAVAAR